MIVELKQQNFFPFLVFTIILFLSIFNQLFPKTERKPRTEWCPECCGDPGCDLTDCFNPFICPKLSILEKNPSNGGNSLFNNDNILRLQY